MKAEVLQAIITFADHAHGEQKRKYTSERYIMHPIRVMQTCQQYSHEPFVLAAALLHDVIEDTPVSGEDIAKFLRTLFSEEQVNRTVDVVVELTDVYTKKAFPQLNWRSRKRNEGERLATASAEAQTIKYADLIDNAIDIAGHDPDFGYVYLQEAKALLEKMTNGNPILYQRAFHTILECIDRVKKVEK
jgi:guanosine-3',5'-bis(diphosphate) 3'-pyrophosphohydrolase